MPKFSDLVKGEMPGSKDFDLKVGMIIRAFVKDTKPPKIKRFIIIGITDNKLLVGTVFINSELNIDALTKQHQRFQYKLLKTKDREFLDRDSFVDCSDLRERDYSEIQNIVISDQNSVIGILSDKDLMNINFNIVDATTIPNQLKKKYHIVD
jgi:hypothetical protein